MPPSPTLVMPHASAARPSLRAAADGSVHAEREGWRPRRFEVEGDHLWLFCENETNTRRLYGISVPGPFKDGINGHAVPTGPAP